MADSTSSTEKSAPDSSSPENKGDKITLPKATVKSSAQAKKVASTSSVASSTHTTKTTRAVNKNTPTIEKTNQSLSKTALLALLLSLIALAGIGAGYIWTMQQQQIFADKMAQNNLLMQKENQQKIQQLLGEQQNKANAKLQQLLAASQAENKVAVEQLTATIARIDQKQPSDWLVHEAEYLIRVAARTMWLERDTRAAISLLEDANSRLKELNSPKYLPVRQLIHQDVEALKLMPVLDTNEIVLILMALNNQVSELPLAMVNLAEIHEGKIDLTLSENTADWRANLQKTWQKFLNDFITVRRRTGSVEPLMSPQQQQNLRQNLSLKIQLALWSASEEKGKVYQQSLTDIGQWLSHYFDMDSSTNKAFYQRIESLKAMLVSYKYPTDLASLTAIHSLLADKSSNTQAIPVQLPEPAQEVELINNTVPVNSEPVEKERVKKTLNDTKNEGSL